VRLRHVQRAILEWLDRRPARFACSACAPAKPRHCGCAGGTQPKGSCPGDRALIELDPTNAAIARGRIARLDLALTVVEADAGTTDTYPGLVPADLVLLSGIMGNISAPDIERLVGVSRQFCAAGATVIWTRGAQDPDLGPDIRRWFDQAGFEELSCEEWIEGTGMRVGVNRLITPPQPLRPGEVIFTFYR